MERGGESSLLYYRPRQALCRVPLLILPEYFRFLVRLLSTENHVRRDASKLHYGWSCLHLTIVEADGTNKFFHARVNRAKGRLLHEGVRSYDWTIIPDSASSLSAIFSASVGITRVQCYGVSFEQACEVFLLGSF